MKKIFILFIFLSICANAVPVLADIDEYQLQLQVQRTQDAIQIQKNSTSKGTQTDEILNGKALQDRLRVAMENMRRFFESMKRSTQSKIRDIANVGKISSQNAQDLSRQSKLDQEIKMRQLKQKIADTNAQSQRMSENFRRQSSR